MTNPAAPEPLCTADLLLVLFIGLRLANEIDWSWWLVLSPLWIMFAFRFAGNLLKRSREESCT